MRIGFFRSMGAQQLLDTDVDMPTMSKAKKKENITHTHLHNDQRTHREWESERGGEWESERAAQTLTISMACWKLRSFTANAANWNNLHVVHVCGAIKGLSLRVNRRCSCVCVSLSLSLSRYWYHWAAAPSFSNKTMNFDLAPKPECLLTTKTITWLGKKKEPSQSHKKFEQQQQ